MAIIRRAHGSATAWTTSQALFWSASAATGDRVFVVALNTATIGSAPAGWTAVATGTANGYAMAIWEKDTTYTVGDTAPTVTASGGTGGVAWIEHFASDVGGSTVVRQFSEVALDSTTGSTAFSATTSGTPTSAAADWFVGFYGLKSSATMSSNATSQAMTQSGATVGTLVGQFGARLSGASPTNSLYYACYTRPVTTGATAAMVLSATGGGSAANVAGPGGLMVLRETVLATDATPTPAVVAAVSTVDAVTVATDATTAPSVVVSTAVVPTVSVFDLQVTVVSEIQIQATVPAPTVLAFTDAAVSPAVIALAAALDAMTGSTGSTVTPTEVSAVTVVPAVTVTQVEDRTVTPTAVAAVAAIDVVNVSGSSIAQPTEVVATTVVPAPTVIADASATVTPPVVVATAQVPAATITANSNAQVSPSEVVATAAVPAVSVSTNVSNVVTPSEVVGTTVVQTAVVTISDNTNPLSVDGVTSVPAVTVTAESSATVTPQAIVVVAAVDSVSVQTGTTTQTSPAVVDTYVIVPAVTIIADANANVTPAVVVGTTAVPTPTLLTASNATVICTEVLVTTVFDDVGIQADGVLQVPTVIGFVQIDQPTIGIQNPNSVGPVEVQAVTDVLAPSIIATQAAIVTVQEITSFAIFDPATAGTGTSIDAALVAVGATVDSVAIDAPHNATAYPALLTGLADFGNDLALIGDVIERIRPRDRFILRDKPPRHKTAEGE